MQKLSLFLAICTLFLSGCTTEPTPRVAIREVPDVPIGEKTRDIGVGNLVIKVRRGQEVGQLSKGLLCVPSGTLLWNSGKISMQDSDFHEVLIDAMKSKGFSVSDNPDALFGTESAMRAELLVGGLVDDIKASLCTWNGKFHGGDAYVHVRWQIYDVLRREVVAEFSTEGSSDVNTAGVSGIDDILLNAFAVAVENLTADEGFRKLVFMRQEKPGNALAGQKDSLLVLRAGDDSVQKPADAKAAVATILVRDGHGSGFFVTPDGYLMTNNHVVGDAEKVMVRLSSGLELAGKVLRRERARDIALVKVEGRGFPFLSLRQGRPAVGDEVFAIGAPLDESLAGTMTRGIVSAWRKDKAAGLDFLQSDVAINHGNSGGPLVDGKGRVVAVCVSARMVGEAQQGLNFFIPVDSALDTLSLEVR